LRIKSCDNLADLFTKSLSLATFDKCVKCIGMRRLKILHHSRGFSLNRISYFLISTEKIYYLFLPKLSYMISSTLQGRITNSLKYKFEFISCGQLTSQTKLKTQAPTSSGTDNNEVVNCLLFLLFGQEQILNI
jgi:hypothetical protein